MVIQSINTGTTHPSPERKVKSGCQTCKRRKVKCDEGWPACRRCESTGRDCDGYGVWGGGSQRCVLQEEGTTRKLMAKWKPSSTRVPPLVLFRPVQLVTLRTDERECFEWFIRRSAVKLPGVFASQHWTTLLVQAGISEPAVRHAILALSSAHKEEVSGFGFAGREDNNEQALFTVSQYSKAIGHLQSRFIDTRTVSKQMALISCVLFVSAEFLRGHYANGLLHLEHGLNLLLEHRSELISQGPSNYVNGWIITMLTRHFVQAKLLGQIPGLPCQHVIGLGLQDATRVFTNMHHARRNLEHILLRALDLQERSSVEDFGKTCRSSMLNEQKKVQSDLQIWLGTSTKTMEQFSPSGLFMERFAYRLLQLYYYMIVIIVNTCLNPTDELQFDHQNSVFLKILSDSIEIYGLVRPNGKPDPRGHHDPEPSSPNSVSDIGWIPPLYYTAVKCRNPCIRHLAIQLMQKAPHREGIWNADLAVTVARKIVETEESDFYGFTVDHDKYKNLSLPSDDDLAVLALPVESRLSDTVVSLPHNRAGKLLLSSCGRIGDQYRWIDEEYDLHFRRWINSMSQRAPRVSDLRGSVV